MAALVLVPILAAVLGGFRSTGELRVAPFALPDPWRGEFYAEILSSGSFWRYLGNSLFIATMTVLLTLVLASTAAFTFSHIRFFGSRFLLSYLLLGMMFPLAAAIVPLFVRVRDIGLLDSAWGVILPQVAFGLGFATLLLKSFFDEMPRTLFEAARIDGCGYVTFFLRFTLPLSLPALAPVAVFVFVGSWNAYLLPLVVLNAREGFPWTLGMMRFQGEHLTEWNRLLAFVSLALVPAIAFFLVAQRYLVAGLSADPVEK